MTIKPVVTAHTVPEPVQQVERRVYAVAKAASGLPKSETTDLPDGLVSRVGDELSGRDGVVKELDLHR